MRSQKILPSQMSDDALLDLVAFAKRLDQPEILVPPIGCLDGAKEQATPSRDTTYSVVWCAYSIETEHNNKILWHYIFRPRQQSMLIIKELASMPRISMANMR